MRTRGKLLAILFSAAILSVAIAVPVAAGNGPPGFGELYLDGNVVNTVVPPAAMPQEGRDNFYAVPDQLAVVAVGPGSAGYHGGQWAFHAVSWNVAPYLLTSEAEVLAAEAAGDITVTRIPENDFKCPVQK